MLLKIENLINNWFNVNKKRISMKRLALILLVFVIVTACQKVSEIKSEKKTQLSDMQVTACNTADEAKTCNTRLAELGIVLKEDCCEALGKCC